MAKLSILNPKKRIHIIVYGPPKSGKTKLVGDLAKHGFHLHFFDLENGSSTLATNLPVEFHDNVSVYAIPDTKDFPMAIETVLKVVRPGKYKICDTHGKVDCPLCGKILSIKDMTRVGTFSEFDNQNLTDKDIVVYDSLTQLSNSAMNHVGLSKDDLWKPEWEHFRSQGQLLERVLSTIQNAPWHCIVITHEMSIEHDESTGSKEKIIPVGGTRNFARTVPKYFDEVVYVEVKNLQHKASSSTTYSQNVLTGSRSNSVIEKQAAELGGSSLLPIFAAQRIGGAETILEQIKLEIKTAKESK